MGWVGMSYMRLCIPPACLSVQMAADKLSVFLSTVSASNTPQPARHDGLKTTEDLGLISALVERDVQPAPHAELGLSSRN